MIDLTMILSTLILYSTMIDLTMILYVDDASLFSHGQVTPRIGLFGNYGATNKFNSRHTNIQTSPPLRLPFELMVRFEQGSFDLTQGKPGGIGNPKLKGRATTIRRRLPFATLYVNSW